MFSFGVTNIDFTFLICLNMTNRTIKVLFETISYLILFVYVITSHPWCCCGNSANIRHSKVVTDVRSLNIFALIQSCGHIDIVRVRESVYNKLSVTATGFVSVPSFIHAPYNHITHSQERLMVTNSSTDVSESANGNSWGIVVELNSWLQRGVQTNAIDIWSIWRFRDNSISNTA